MRIHKIAAILWFSLACGLTGLANDDLLHPEKATEQAPETFRVKVETTKGDITIKVTRAWSPLGADRFYNLVKLGYFKDIAFYRVIDGFMAQFGFHGDPKVNEAWQDQSFKDDPRNETNGPGRISFANRGKNTRSTQFFINTANNRNLDPMGFTPFGEVEGDGLKIVKSLYDGYGEGAPRGNGPSQGKIMSEGNGYLKEQFPKLDYKKSVSLIKD